MQLYWQTVSDLKHAPWQYCNISYNSTNNAGDESQSCNIYNSTNYAGDVSQSCNIYNSTNYAGDELQSCNISCNNTNNIDYTIEKQWRLPHNNKYCFTITPTNYFGSGMQLNCKLLSCYCKQVWYFIGGCSPIQCENNNGDMSGGLCTVAIIGIVFAVIIVIILTIVGICIVYCIGKKQHKKNQQKEPTEPIEPIELTEEPTEQNQHNN